MLHTQLSGKYSDDDKSLFDFKKRLDPLFKIDSFRPEKTIFVCDQFEILMKKSGDDIRFLQHLAYIRKNSVHIIYNSWKHADGYVGLFQAIEITYAIIHQKLIVITSPPIIPMSIPKEIKKTIESFEHKFILFNGEVRNYNINYEISTQDLLQIFKIIHREIEKHLKK